MNLSPKETFVKLKCSVFWRKLFKNASVALVGSTGASAVGLITLSILVRSLGVGQYAIFVLAQQYMTVVDALVNFQSWQAIIKFGADAKVRGDNRRLFADIKLGLVMDLLTAAAGLLLALLLIRLIGMVFSWGDELQLAAFVFSLEIIFHIEGSSIGILRLFDKFHWTATCSVILAVVKLIAVAAYAFAPIEHSLMGFVVVYVVTDILNHVSLLLLAMVCLHGKFGLRKVFGTPIKCSDKDFVRFCVWANVGSAVDVPVKYLDVFIISAVSVDMVAVYKVFKQVLQVFSLVANPVSAAIMPQLSELISEGKPRRAFDAIMRIRNAIFVAMAICLVAAGILGYPLFDFFFGSTYAAHLPLFLVLLVVRFYALMYVALHPLFFSLGLAREDSVITLASNAAYLLIAFCLVGLIGVYAIVLATAIQYAITNVTKVVLAKRQISRLMQ